jgi:hypothetical protein
VFVGNPDGASSVAFYFFRDRGFAIESLADRHPPSGHLAIDPRGRSDVGTLNWRQTPVGRSQANVQWVSPFRNQCFVKEWTTGLCMKVTVSRNLILSAEKLRDLGVSAMRPLWEAERVDSEFRHVSPFMMPIVELRAAHLSCKEIAKRLGISATAVDSYLSRAAADSHCDDRSALLRMAQREDFVEMGCPPGACTCEIKRSDSRLPECPNQGGWIVELP